MLLGERLGRRHQRAAVAVLDGTQQRVQRDDRLARADVALEQPLHRRRAREVCVDLADRSLLMLGERERQRLAVTRDQLARHAERRRDRRLARPSRARETELQDEQLVERETRAPTFRLGEGARTVQRVRAHRRARAAARVP